MNQTQFGGGIPRNLWRARGGKIPERHPQRCRKINIEQPTNRLPSPLAVREAAAKDTGQLPTPATSTKPARALHEESLP